MIGQSIAHYRVTAKLGQGGMGEVYRATDTKLGREVAIKVLPSSFSRDAHSLARFEREARALATLNHPHIAAIHGFDSDQGTHFLVLELVEGETLAERLRRGPLPVEVALKVAREIAEAIESAHEKGIIHRDLKPGNVKLTPDGRVKVLDFGLAKIKQPVAADVRRLTSPSAGIRSEPLHVGGHEAALDSPTIIDSVHTSTPGAILGTPAYMSPEQARGQEVDRRTDVWAFGCCLYECLSGRKPFRGETITDLIAEVLKSDPDWSHLPTETPPAVVTMLHRCLEKEPRRRLSSMGDIAITLEETTQISRESSRTRSSDANQKRNMPTPGHRGVRAWLRPAIAGLLLGLLVAVAVFWSRSGLHGTSAPSIRSVAVLPFDNLSADPELDALCNGLSDDISTGLKKTGLLDKVPLWGSVKGYKGSTAPVRKIAEELGVDSLVHATIKRDGKELKVNADLIDGASGKPLWSETFSTKDGDIGRVQSEVVLGLLNHLRLKLSADQQTRLGNARSVNGEAYAAYRRGLEHFDLVTKDGFARAEQEFEKARQLDPKFVDPIAYLVTLRWYPIALGISSGTLQEGFREAKVRLAEAIRVDAKHGSVIRARGWIAYVGDWDWKQAIECFREAASIDPEDPHNFNALASYAANVEGRLADALSEVDHALRLDPERVFFLEVKASCYRSHGRYAEALALYQRILNQHPERWSSLSAVARCLRYLKRLDEARVAAESAVQLSNRSPDPLSVLASIYVESGAREQAQEIVTELEAKAKQTYVSTWSLAYAHASLGDMESALKWLEKGFAEKDSWPFTQAVRTHASLGLFGDQPRYWALVDRLKLPALPIEHAFYEKEQQMRFRAAETTESAQRAANKSTPASGLEMTRVLVLPLQSRGKEEADIGFAGGLTDELRGKLSKIGGLRVIDGSTLTNIQNADLAGRCRDLKAGSVLKGAVQQIGGRLNVRLELQSSQTPEVLWSDEQTHDLKDIFALQSQVAQAVAKALSVQLRPAERQELDRRPTQNLEAYQLYLRARDLWNRRTADDLTKAITLFEAAIQKDTNYARAYAGLADCYVLTTMYSGEPPGTAFPKAIAMAEQALRLDPTLADPHAALGYAKFAFHWDWEGAEKEFQATIKLDPTYANGHHWYADMLYCLGTRKEEGLAEAKIALELDPTPVNHARYAQHLVQIGQIDEAIAYLRKQIATDPSFALYNSFIGLAYLEKGMSAEAIDVLEKAVLTRATAGAALAKAYALAGRMSDARKILAQLQELQRQGADWRTSIAWIHHTLGDDESALSMLEQVVAERGALINFFYYQDAWRDLRPNPRFQAILKKVNLLK